MEIHARRSSPSNFAPEVVAEARDVGEVRICDVTLREGEMASEAMLRPEEKVEIAGKLQELGVHQIQVGFARQDAETVRLFKRAGIDVPLELICAGYSPNWQAELDTALDVAADSLFITMRGSDAQLALIGLSRQQATELAVANVEYARRQGAKKIVFAPSPATTADLAFIREISLAAVRAGAQCVSIADSLGVSKPAAVKHIVREVKRAVGVPIRLHCHNDLGLAVACTLAGLEGGATWADVSIGGVGERAGNAALEEVVVALRCLYDIDPGLKTEHCFALSRTVSRILGMPLSSIKPVVGDDAFAQKQDAQITAGAQHPELFEPFDPALVGHRRWIRLSKSSGPVAVRTKLAELGLTASEEEVSRLVTVVNESAARTKRPVSDEVLVGLLQSFRNCAVSSQS